MIASDLDGTLLDAMSQLAPRTCAAIDAASTNGVAVVAATGRSHLTAAPRLRAAPAIRWAVCSNGATVYDLHNNSVVAHSLIADRHLAELAHVWGRFPDLALGWETTDGFGADRQFQRRHPAADGLREVAPSAHPPRAGVVKLLVSHQSMGDRQLIDHLRPHLPDALEVATSGAPFIEITGAGVNKATGLAHIATMLGIRPDDVVVFGDNHNDLPMFRWAGTAIAMGNAVAEVKAIAHDITAHHADDGVAVAIEALLAKLPPAA